MKAVFKTAKPYQGDMMGLPVGSLEEAIPFYESVMGFRVISRHGAPHRSAVLGRDEAGFRMDRYGDVSYRVFFVIAPDGLCCCLGERQG